MSQDWKKFRENIELEETEKVKSMLKENDNARLAIKKHLMKDSELSTTALVSLVVSYNSNTPIQESEIAEELNIHGYLTDGKITKKAVEYINSDKVMAKLKELVDNE